MLSISDNDKILVRCAAGEPVPLRESGVVNRLSSAFVQAGLKDEKILALELVLALENSLKQRCGGGKIISAASVNTLLARYLEGAGLGAVAKCFRQLIPEEQLLFSVSEENLHKLLQEHLGLSGNDLRKTVHMVCAALQCLQITEAEPQLIWELGRHYERNGTETAFTFDAGLPVPPAGGTSRIPEQFTAALNSISKTWFESGVLRFSDSNQIFAEPRLLLDFPLLLEKRGLQLPLLELLILPIISELVQVLRELSGAWAAETGTPVVSSGLIALDGERVVSCSDDDDAAFFLRLLTPELPAGWKLL